MHILKLGIEILIYDNITGLRNWFENSKSGSTITCEEGLAPSQRPFENQLKTNENTIQLNDINLVILTWNG